MDVGKSIVAQVMQEIELQNEAAQRGLTGIAITSRHAFIIARMERIARIALERRKEVSNEQVVKEVDEAVDAIKAELAERYEQVKP